MYRCLFIDCPPNEKCFQPLDSVLRFLDMCFGIYGILFVVFVRCSLSRAVTAFEQFHVPWFVIILYLSLSACDYGSCAWPVGLCYGLEEGLERGFSNISNSLNQAA